MKDKCINRRDFLATTAAGSLGLMTAPSAAMLAWPSFPGQVDRSALKTPDGFRRALVGPIQSQPTPFTEKLEVDHESVRRIVRRGLHYGVRTYELTAGNSKYFALSYEEIKQLTRTLVEAVDGNGITIAATGAWWTDRAVDYARYAESVGADAVQILMPSPHGDEASLVRHFEAIAKAVRLPIVLHGQYDDSLLTKLVHIETIVAMKEDAALDYYIDRIIGFGDRLNIFGGGAESRYLVGYPYGATAYFATYTGFAPDIAMKFWHLVLQGDVKGAAKVTEQYDYPFIKQFSIPWWHATLEYFGVAKRYLRPPMVAYTDEQMKSVKQFFDQQGINPANYSS